jgi:hypothetical protein
MTPFCGFVFIFTNETSLAVFKDQVSFAFFFVHDYFIELCYIGMINFFQQGNFVVDKLSLRLVLAESAL